MSGNALFQRSRRIAIFFTLIVKGRDITESAIQLMKSHKASLLQSVKKLCYRWIVLVVVIVSAGPSCRHEREAVTLNQMSSMPPFRATVQDVHVSDFKAGGVVLLVVLKKDDGSEVRLLEASASSNLVKRAYALIKQQAYTFPDVLK